MYFAQKGPDNTDTCIELALKTAAERGIKHIVVASGTGATARKLLGKGVHTVCVTNSYGFREPGITKMQPEIQKELEAGGIAVFHGSHALSGAERGISKKHGGISPVEIVAETLRMLGQGVKVCVEIATMALDAGLIPHGEDIIVLGGSNHGCDTAVIMAPAHANSILETKVREIICKPYTF